MFKKTLDSGKVFDYSKKYFYDPLEANIFLNNYFTKDDICGKNVLDAGCRVGDYTNSLINGGANKVTGVDLSKKCISVAKKKYKNKDGLEFYVGSITDLKRFNDSKFDIILCMGTIFYLKPSEMVEALNEFVRVCRSGGIILVNFHKEKSFLYNFIRDLANLLPLKLYVFLIELATPFLFLIKPILRVILGRGVSLKYFKYNILLSLRGLYFGAPINKLEKFRIETKTSENASEKMLTTYKIKVPEDKSILIFNLKK